MSPTFSSTDEPAPPALHWALLLLIDIATIGIFGIVWCFVQAKFARKVTVGKAVLWYSLWLVLVLVVSMLDLAFHDATVGKWLGLLYGLLSIASLLSYQAGNFSVKNAVERYYESTDESGRRLGGMKTIFFGQIGCAT